MNRFRASEANEDGFTLIELLVSMVIVSLMSVYAFNLISRLKDIHRIEQTIAEEQIIQVARDHLRNVIGGSRTRFNSADAGLGQLVFFGQSDRVTVSNTMDERLVFGSLYNITYRADAGALVLNMTTEESPPLRQEPTILLKDVNSLSFRYFGQKQNEPTPAWHDSWSEKQLPLLVEIKLEFGNNSTQKWSPLIVALEASITSGITPTN
jgi:prepilin-type N-terminal cleavage/methylation domain-containing protein